MGFCQAAKKKVAVLSMAVRQGFTVYMDTCTKGWGGGAYNPGLQLVFYGIDI